MRQKYEINIRRTFITPFHGGRILSVGNSNTAGHRQQSRCAPRGRHQHGGGGGKLACTVHRSARAAAEKGGARDCNKRLSLSGTEQGGGRCVELAAPEGRGCRHIRTRHGNGNALRTHSGTPFGSAATAVGTNGNTAKTMDSRGFQAVGIVLPATNR